MLSLPEYAAQNGINLVFGAYTAYRTFGSGDTSGMSERGDVRVVFHRLIVVVKGSLEVLSDEMPVHIESNQLIVVPPSALLTVVSCSDDMVAEALYIDDNVAPFGIHQLTTGDMGELLEIFHIMRGFISRHHIYNIEMLQSMVGVLRHFIAELPYERHGDSRDLRHKKDIFETFVHLAKRNFREERQVNYYAGRLNITSTYLSRTVKEMSGGTVNEYLTSMVYNEACNLLRHTELTVGEIALKLHFNDQSALSNFFKSRSGMSPLAYRKESKTP